MPATRRPPGRTTTGSYIDHDDLPFRKLYRSAEGRLLGGVARGLAGHLGLPVLWLRIAFAALLFARGMGVLLYAGFWFFVPLGVGGVDMEHQPQRVKGLPIRTRWRSRTGRRKYGRLAAGFAIFATASVLSDNLRLGSAGSHIWPFLLVGAGVALVWRQADNDRRARWMQMGRNRRLLPIARIAAGVVLVSVGVAGFMVIQGSVKHFGAVMQAALAIVAGIALLAGPYLVRMAQDLSAERQSRIRAQERAEVAAHVHDSVLHTLTLIQRRADDPREVARLARAQERELRMWLYRPEGEKDEDDPGTLAEAVRQVAAEVEDTHGLPVVVVLVGDCPLDEKVAAQLQAAREAMVNAAKYGGGGEVNVYAEVVERTVLIFVRDRGPGFDLDQVPVDRMGVRESIIGRMQRNGGRAVLRSVPGGGTEVELEMERA